MLTEEEKERSMTDPSLYIELPDTDAKRAQLSEYVASLNREQRRAYDRTQQHVTGMSGQQMIMFVSGEGGTGKSRLIQSVTLMTQILVGKTEGTWGPVLKTAPTGGAAHNIGGSTWHSALGASVSSGSKICSVISDATILNLTRKAKGTLLFVLDELSLVSCEDLYNISKRLCAATGNSTAPFGGMHVLLAGDFYQMKNVGGVPLMARLTAAHSAEVHAGQSIITNALSDFFMLIHNVRAQQSNGLLSPLAQFATKARVGDVHNAVLHLLNDRVVNDIAVAMRTAHPNALWITSLHKKVGAINKLFKEKRLANNEYMVTVIADHVPAARGVPVAEDPALLNRLYEVRGSSTGGRSEMMISHINLFVGSRVRLIRNLFVEGGLYNGAMGSVWGFVYERDSHELPLRDLRFADMAKEEREIPIVLVQMDGDDETFPYTCDSDVPRLVPIVPIQSQGRVNGDYLRMQLPILPAEARTAHSVQGYTAKDGVVVDPGSMFFAGDYTAISRATCKEKVILLAPLQEKFFTRDTTHRHLVEKGYDRLLHKYPQL
jgi:hypothetical protein